MRQTTRLSLSLALNLGLTIALVLTGQVAHSTSLIADAGHNLTDAVAIGVAFVAIVLARRPPSERRSFGFGRASFLAALANGIVLIVVTGTIIVLAIWRLFHPHLVRGGIMLLAASVSVVMNLAIVVLLRDDHSGHDHNGDHSDHGHGHDHGDLGIRSAWLHAVGDALSGLVVAVAGLIALVASGPVAERVDPIASLLVAAFIIIEAFRVTATSMNELLEGVPSDVDLEEVRQSLREVDRVVDVHDLHVWSLSATSRALSAHLLVEGDPSLSASGVLLQEIRELLERRFRIDHATIEIEGGDSCAHHSHH